MRSVLSALRWVAIALIWGALGLFALCVTILVVTVMSLAWSIDQRAGLAFLAFILMVVWMMFYATK